MIYKLAIAVSFMVAIFVVSNTWTSDAAHAKISFTVKGPFGKVDGSFTGLQTSIKFDEKNVQGGMLTASVDAKTVSTGSGLRNRHLREKEEWFDTDKYPRISFKSTKIEKNAKGFRALGELSIKGISKPVVIPFTFVASGNTGVFKGQFSINRETYNLGKKGGSVGDEVSISLEVPVKK